MGSLSDFSGLNLSGLTLVEQQQVQQLLHKYHTVFAEGEGDIGCTNVITHEIPLVDSVPVRQRHRRIPPSQYEAVKAHIKQLLESQVIRESSSPYASPIVLVQKKDGSLRMCVDYRQLNARTRKDAYPLPRIEESLDALSGARWFSTLDLASGYNQVPVAEPDRHKTAFCTPFGLFEFNRMPFGLCNAPATFQRLMERLFGDQSCQSLLLYLDDVVVFSSTVEQHLGRLEMVLSHLRHQGLKANLSKCCFFRTKVKYLGHLVSREGVATDPEKITVVAEWKRPRSLVELQSFLGFCSYYRRFVEGFAKLAAPLHQVVAELAGAGKRGRRGPGVITESIWTRECNACFQALKTKLVSSPILAYADFSKPFVLETDASHQGLGAVLSQEQDGKLRPIAFASRGLRPTERKMENYSSMKLELLALKWAMTEKFREYLLGQHCLVYTDNNPLSYLQTAKLGALEQRWVAQLASFSFEIKYRPGRLNGNADALSRQYEEEEDVMVAEAGAVVGPRLPLVLRQSQSGLQCQDVRPGEANQRTITALPIRQKADLATLQAQDPVIGRFCDFWRRGYGPDHAERTQLLKPVLELLRQWERIEQKQDVLYRAAYPSGGGKKFLQLLLPEILKKEVLTSLHDDHGHQGVERTMHLIRQRVFWPGMGKDVNPLRSIVGLGPTLQLFLTGPLSDWVRHHYSNAKNGFLVVFSPEKAEKTIKLPNGNDRSRDKSKKKKRRIS
ncbi:UNVERIFIED_CONTAM: hypothetical protein FKN15_073716 [Acipenser sinensis]